MFVVSALSQGDKVGNGEPECGFHTFRPAAKQKTRMPKAPVGVGMSFAVKPT